MKKAKYLNPSTEVITLVMNTTLLAGSPAETIENGGNLNNLPIPGGYDPSSPVVGQ